MAAGLLSPDAVYTAMGNNVILHAIGEQAVEEASDWYTQPLEPGGRLLLCSDGYWKTMQPRCLDTGHRHPAADPARCWPVPWWNRRWPGTATTIRRCC